MNDKPINLNTKLTPTGDTSSKTGKSGGDISHSSINVEPRNALSSLTEFKEMHKG